MRKALLLITVVLLLTACGRSGTGAGPQLVEVNDWSLEQHRGNVVILYFWQANCPPCVAKLGDLNELVKELPADVDLVLINLGDSADRINRVAAGYTRLQVVTAGRPLFIQHGIRYTPTTVFVDKDGRVFDERVGPLENQELIAIAQQKR